MSSQKILLPYRKLICQRSSDHDSHIFSWALTSLDSLKRHQSSRWDKRSAQFS
jgi:hypothetical protein